jgi:Mannosyltransferase (PIG-V)
MRLESPAVKLPIWVRALDAAALVMLVLTTFVFLFGGFSITFSLTPLRVHSTGRLLFLAAALLAIRHAAHPSTPLHARIVDWLRRRDERPAGNAAALALWTRVAVLFLGYMAVVTIGANKVTTGFELSPDKLLNLPARFDAGWYVGIALDGYSFGGDFKRQENIAFFPAFPMLMRAAGYPIGAYGPGMPRERRLARLLWGGVILSVIAFAWAASYLWRLARDTIGEPRAFDAIALLAAYPFAVFFSAPYTESLFLLGSVAAVYHFRREEWIRAGIWGLIVGLTRPNGCFLSVVLACLLAERLWRERKQISTFPRSQISKSLVSAAMPGVGMLAYSVYVHQLTGRYFGWARLHEAWGRSYSGLAPMERAYGWITDEGLLHVIEGVPFDTLNSLGLIFALLMLWPVLRRLGPAMALFVVVNAIPPMLAGGVLSMGRLTATLFPVFLALAAIAPPRVVTALVISFAAGQGLAAVLFFTWRPLF